MAIKRKSKEPVKVSLPRRTKRHFKFRSVEHLVDFVPRRTAKNTTHIMDLPNEILLNVFAHFSTKELFSNIRPVCRKWKQLAMSPILWREIHVCKKVPTDILTNWIQSATLLKNFSMKDRDDTNLIAEQLSKKCKQLESIKFQNCWGTTKSYMIRSTPLCNLVTRCPKLYNFNFSQSRFMSRKFFQLISKDKRNGKLMKKCNYIGPMSMKQMKALFSALRDYEIHDTATIGNVTLNQKFKLRDILRCFQDIQNPRHLVTEVWQNLNYGANVHENDENIPMHVDA